MYYSTHERWNTFCGDTGNHKKTASRKPYCFQDYLRSASFNAWCRKPLNILRLVFITPVALLWTHISLGWRSEAQGELKGDRSCQHTLEKKKTEIMTTPVFIFQMSSLALRVVFEQRSCHFPFTHREIRSALFVLLACCVDSFHRFRSAK